MPANAAGPSKIKAKRLLKKAQARKQQLPKTLFIPGNQTAPLLSAEAKRQGITVVSVPEDQLLTFIGEAREGFREQFGGSTTQ